MYYVNGVPQVNCGTVDKCELVQTALEIEPQNIPEGSIWNVTCNGLQIPEIWDKEFSVPDGAEFIVTLVEGTL